MSAERERSPRTVEQAAEDLNLSPSTVRAWIAQRRLGFIRLGRAVRIPSAEIDRVLNDGFVPAAGTAPDGDSALVG